MLCKHGPTSAKIWITACRRRRRREITDILRKKNGEKRGALKEVRGRLVDWPLRNQRVGLLAQTHAPSPRRESRLLLRVHPPIAGPSIHLGRVVVVVGQGSLKVKIPASLLSNLHRGLQRGGCQNDFNFKSYVLLFIFGMVAKLDSFIVWCNKVNK